MLDLGPANPPRILTIAGSDPSGGAGIEADLKVFTAHGCYGMTAITALTAQNTTGVKDVHNVPVTHFEKSLKAVLEDMPPDVIKTGMLTSADHIHTMMKVIREEDVNPKHFIVDPVMVSSSGATLLPDEAVVVLVQLVLSKASMITPNIPEALLLLKAAGKPFRKTGIGNLDEMRELCKKLREVLGTPIVVLKGGHCPMDEDANFTKDEQKIVQTYDLCWDGEHEFMVTNPWIKTRSTHGTGCSLSAAIASNFAKGFKTYDAVSRACKYVQAGISMAPKFGDQVKGHGPIDHLHSTYMLPFAPGKFIDYLLEHPKVRDPWKAYTEHDFVNQLGAGTLDTGCFAYYLIQDYLFLTHFARANALAAYKCTDNIKIASSAGIAQHMHREMLLHVEYCMGFGISRSQMESAEESQACTAYTRYILDIGHSSDYLALQIAMAPCLLGYGAIAKRLWADPKTVRGSQNRYWKWIGGYVGKDYTDAMARGRVLLEEEIIKQGVGRVEELVDIFVYATKMETGFWEMGLDGTGKGRKTVLASMGVGEELLR